MKVDRAELLEVLSGVINQAANPRKYTLLLEDIEKHARDYLENIRHWDSVQAQENASMAKNRMEKALYNVAYFRTGAGMKPTLTVDKD